MTGGITVSRIVAITTIIGSAGRLRIGTRSIVGTSVITGATSRVLLLIRAHRVIIGIIVRAVSAATGSSHAMGTVIATASASANGGCIGTSANIFVSPHSRRAMCVAVVRADLRSSRPSRESRRANAMATGSVAATGTATRARASIANV